MRTRAVLVCVVLGAAGCGGSEPRSGTSTGSVDGGATPNDSGRCFVRSALCEDPNSSTGWTACANGGWCVAGIRGPSLCCPAESVMCNEYPGCSPSSAQCPSRARICRGFATPQGVTECESLLMAGWHACGGLEANLSTLMCPSGLRCGANSSAVSSVLEARRIGNPVSDHDPALFCFPDDTRAADALSRSSQVSPTQNPRDSRIPVVDRSTGCVIGPPTGDVYPGGPVFSNLGGCGSNSASCSGGCIPLDRTCCGTFSCLRGDSCADQGYCRRGGMSSMMRQCMSPAPDLRLNCGVGYRCGAEGCCDADVPYFCRGRCFSRLEAALEACPGGSCIQCSP